MKCDETRPSCKNCSHRGVSCPGYSQTLRWSQKHERHKLRASSTAFRASTTITSNTKSTGPTNSGQNSNDCATSENETYQRSFQADGETGSDFDSLSAYSPSSFDRLPAGAHSTLPSTSHHVPTDLLRLLEDGVMAAFGPPSANDQQNCEEAGQIMTRFSTDPTNISHIPIQPNLSPNLDGIAQKLMSYYFHTICRTLSCFDSSRSPLRSDIPYASFEATHIYDCMLGISATHMANFDQDLAMAALEYQGRTMRSLQAKIDELSTTKGQCSAKRDARTAPTTRKTRHYVLLTTILLGVTAVSYLL